MKFKVGDRIKTTHYFNETNFKYETKEGTITQTSDDQKLIKIVFTTNGHMSEQVLHCDVVEHVYPDYKEILKAL